MALNGLICADVPLRNYSVTQSVVSGLLLCCSIGVWLEGLRTWAEFSHIHGAAAARVFPCVSHSSQEHRSVAECQECSANVSVWLLKSQQSPRASRPSQMWLAVLRSMNYAFSVKWKRIVISNSNMSCSYFCSVCHLSAIWEGSASLMHLNEESGPQSRHFLMMMIVDYDISVTIPIMHHNNGSSGSGSC